MRGLVAALIIGMQLLCSVLVISSVGQPCKPLSGGTAAASVIVGALICVGIYWLWAS